MSEEGLHVVTFVIGASILPQKMMHYSPSDVVPHPRGTDTQDAVYHTCYFFKNELTV
jgi:hypothetical protein